MTEVERRAAVSCRAGLGLWAPAIGAVLAGGWLVIGGGWLVVVGVGLIVGGAAFMLVAAGARLEVVDGALHQRVLWLPGRRAGWLPPVDLRRLVSVEQWQHLPGTRRSSVVLTVRDAHGVERDVHLAAWLPSRRLRKVIEQNAARSGVVVRAAATRR